MWTTYLCLFTLVQVIYASIIAAKLKDVPDVEQITYLNTANIAVSAGMLGAEAAVFFGRHYFCGEFQLDIFASILLILSTVVSFSIFVAIAANSQFDNCPSSVKTMVYYGIAGNIVILLLSIYSIYYSVEHRHNLGEIIGGKRRLFRAAK